MEFWTSLIVVDDDQSQRATGCLQANCTHVFEGVWIFEGDTEVLEEYGVRFNVVSEGAVPALGGLSQDALVVLCGNCFLKDVKKLSFSEADMPHD